MGHKLKRFCTVKETIDKTKQNPTKCQNIFANDIIYIQKYINSTYNSTSKKINNVIEKWVELNRHVSKEDMQITNRYMKRCSTLIIYQGNANQIHNEIYNHTPFRMAIIDKNTNNTCQQECGEKGTFIHCQWECKLVQPVCKTVWSFLKNTKNRTTIGLRNSIPV